MARTYPLALPQPRELELGDRVIEAFETFDRVVEERWPGLSGFPEAGDGRICLPSIDALRFEGRALRGDEDDRAIGVLEAVAAALAPRRVFWRFSEMFTLDWDAMDGPTSRTVRAAIEAAVADVESSDEDGPAPWLWTSMEPPGQQVEACMEPAAYAAWRRRFLHATGPFPYRDA